MNRHEVNEGAGKERILDTGGQPFSPETATGVSARIRDYKYVNVEEAQDQLFRIAAKLAFIQESAPPRVRIVVASFREILC